jgi:O-acetyl-ADP-ribose deacetylase (regulator of RNase III)
VLQSFEIHFWFHEKHMNQLLAERSWENGGCLQIVQGDITQEMVDAIVNAANSQLQHGGGVARAIAARGGEIVQRESDAWVREHGPVDHAKPAYTSGGDLPCQFVIHAVGPIWRSDDERAANLADAKLTAAVRGALKLAHQLGLESLAMPAISTGIYGFPKERAAGIIYRTIDTFFSENPDATLQQVRLTLFDQPTVDVFTQVWDEINPG